MTSHEDLSLLLVEDSMHHEEKIRVAATSALQEVIGEYPAQLEAVIDLLLSEYREKLYVSMKSLFFTKV